MDKTGRLNDFRYWVNRHSSYTAEERREIINGIEFQLHSELAITAMEEYNRDTYQGNLRGR